MSKCKICGNEISDDSVYCPFCGAKVDSGIDSSIINNGSQLKYSDEKGNNAKRSDKITITIPKPNLKKLSKLQPWIILILIGCLIFTGISTNKYNQIIDFMRNKNLNNTPTTYYPRNNVIYLSISGDKQGVDYSVVNTHPVVEILFEWTKELMDVQYKEQIGQDYHVNIKPLKKGIGTIKFTDSANENEGFNVLVIVGD